MVLKELVIFNVAYTYWVVELSVMGRARKVLPGTVANVICAAIVVMTVPLSFLPLTLLFVKERFFSNSRKL